MQAGLQVELLPDNGSDVGLQHLQETVGWTETEKAMRIHLHGRRPRRRIHQSRTGNFVFVDWWADENEFHHHVYVPPLDRPEDLEYMTPTGLAACAWDLFLIGQERDARVNHVLKSGDIRNLKGYLQAR